MQEAGCKLTSCRALDIFVRPYRFAVLHILNTPGHCHSFLVSQMRPYGYSGRSPSFVIPAYSSQNSWCKYVLCHCCWPSN